MSPPIFSAIVWKWLTGFIEDVISKKTSCGHTIALYVWLGYNKGAFGCD